jgi:thiamine biosynthesis lipoprotein
MVLAQKQGFASLESHPENRDGADYFQARGSVLGTACCMLYSAPTRAAADAFRRRVSAWICAFEARYSRFVGTSIISQINDAAGKHEVEIDDELASIFKLCDWFHWSSRGLFDPTTLPLSRLWDYHTEHPQPPTAEGVGAARMHVGWKRVQRNKNGVFLPDKGMALDIGGIGKEYAIDRVMGMAQDSGFQNVMIDFGHDVRVIGTPPEGGGWRIGLENPTDPGRCWTGVALAGMAIASSGNYARGFDWQGKRYGHITDPRTGYPVDNACLSVSVIAPTCTEAGVLATAALILGPEAFTRFMADHHQAEGAMMTPNSSLRTSGFKRYELSATATHQEGQRV